MKKLYIAFLLLMSLHQFAKSQCSDLFFSEYLEGSSNNKALEIYNPTDTATDLNYYRIIMFMNGSSTVTTTFFPKGLLGPKSTYVIVHSSADSLLQLLADTLSGGNVVKFNGDDAMALMHGTDTLDVIGKIGDLPSAGYWTVDTGKTQDNTLVRKININDGESDWAVSSASEWTVYVKDNFSHIGSHTMTSCTITNITPVTKTNNIEVYPNPAHDNLYIENLSGQTTYTVYDVLGNKINCATAITPSDVSINISHLEKGVYLLNMKTNTQQIVKRFVKE